MSAACILNICITNICKYSVFYIIVHQLFIYFSYNVAVLRALKHCNAFKKPTFMLYSFAGNVRILMALN